MSDRSLTQLLNWPLPTGIIEFMIICHCHHVTDREIKSAIAGGATTVEAVSDACGAGSGCGGCSGEIAALLFQQRRVLPLVSRLMTDDLERAS